MVSKRSETLLLAIAVLAILYIIYPEKKPDTLRATRITTSDESNPSKAIKEIYLEQAEQRKMALTGIAMKLNEGLDVFINILVPEVFCLELVRLGDIDEGKWMCSPHRLPTECAIVALGFNNKVSFFEKLQKITKKRCMLVGYDVEEQEESTKEIIKKIGGSTHPGQVTNEEVHEAISYEKVMKWNTINLIDILKVTVTANEHTYLLEFLETHEVPQLLIEVRRDPLKKDKLISDGAFVVELLKYLSELGYRLAAHSINPADNLCEFTFLHSEHLSNYKASLMAKYLS